MSLWRGGRGEEEDFYSDHHIPHPACSPELQQLDIFKLP